MGYHVGEIVVAGQSYFIRQWRQLQMAQYAPVLGLVVLCFFIPEPVRWLVSKGKIKKAKEVLEKEAKISGKSPIPEEMFKPVRNQSKPMASLSFRNSLKAIFQNKTLLGRFLNVQFQWFTAALVYQGTIYMSTTLSGDPHSNFALAMIPSIPGTVLYLILPNKLGRRNTLALSELVLGTN